MRKLGLAVLITSALVGLNCGSSKGGSSPDGGTDGGTDGGNHGGSATCGNGIIEDGEICDDGNAVAGDGCSDTCRVEHGWTCPTVGKPCYPICGDGIVVGGETCDILPANCADSSCTLGCDRTCQLADGYTCDSTHCWKTACGDGKIEGTEQCEDGNLLPFDGCSSTCKNEPVCKDASGNAIACQSVCGDGLVFPDEDCDDGNLRDGDGCDSHCKLEDSSLTGMYCTIVATPVTEIQMVIRDFEGYTGELSSGHGHPDFQHYGCSQVTPSLVLSTLGTDGLPQINPAAKRSDGAYGSCPGSDGNAGTPQITSSQSFFSWYRNSDADPSSTYAVYRYTTPFITAKTLTKDSSGNYVYDSANESSGGFFPIDGKGWGNWYNGHNFGFTTEARYWFTFQGGETLNFTGDDDVWVFINGHLAVDLGGLHSKLGKSVTLPTDAATALSSYGMVAGSIYEMALFHAERHTDASNFKLTLGKFVKKKTVCTNNCGDGIKSLNEECDLGALNSDTGACSTTCKVLSSTPL